MHKRILAGLAAAGIMCAAGSAAANGELLSGDVYESVEAQVERDGSALLGPFVSTSSRCRKTADSRAWIIEAPRYGRASIIKKRGEIAFGDGAAYAHCNDRPIAGTTVRYQPMRGFVGNDSFVFTVRFSDGEVRTKRVSVHVE